MELLDVLLKRQLVETDDDDDEWEAEQQKRQQLTKKFVDSVNKSSFGKLKINFRDADYWLFGGGAGDESVELANELINAIGRHYGYDHEDDMGDMDKFVKFFKAIGMTSGEAHAIIDMST